MDHVRLGDEAEGAQVAQADACEDDVAQLPAGGLDHRGVPEPETHAHHDQRPLNKSTDFQSAV